MILKFWILPTGLLPDKLTMPREATFLNPSLCPSVTTWIVEGTLHPLGLWRPQLILTARSANYVAPYIRTMAVFI